MTNVSLIHILRQIWNNSNLGLWWLQSPPIIIYIKATKLFINCHSSPCGWGWHKNWMLIGPSIIPHASLWRGHSIPPQESAIWPKPSAPSTQHARTGTQSNAQYLIFHSCSFFIYFFSLLFVTWLFEKRNLIRNINPVTDFFPGCFYPLTTYKSINWRKHS